MNEEKITVGNAWRSKFLGFSFYKRDGQPKIRIHQKAINRFKERVRELTHRSSGKSLSQVIYNLNLYLRMVELLRPYRRSDYIQLLEWLDTQANEQDKVGDNCYPDLKFIVQ